MDDLVSSQSQQTQPNQAPATQQATPLPQAAPVAQQPPVDATQPVPPSSQVPAQQPAMPVAPQELQPAVSKDAANSVPPVTQAVSSQPVGQATRVQEPPSHSGGVHKEYAPMPPLTPDMAVEHKEEPLIVTSEPDVMLPPELKEVGVEEGDDVKEQAFFKAMQQANAELGTNEQAQQSAVGGQAPNASMPMTFEQAFGVKKRGKIWDSVTWLASLIVYQWKKMHPIATK